MVSAFADHCPALTRLRRGVVLTLLAAGVAAAAEPCRLGPGVPRQRLCDWGVTLSPVDWDGALMSRDPRQSARLCRGLHVTAVRLLVGGISTFDAGRGVVRRQLFEWAVVPQIRALAGAGLPRYTLSFLTAPSLYKTLYSYQPYVDGVPNRLRPGTEAAVADYFVQVLAVLRDAGVPLPVAIGLQADPGRPAADYGCPVTLAQGTLYDFPQWAALARQARARLDAAGFTEVGILGPESAQPEWLERAGQEPGFAPGAPRAVLAGLSFLAGSPAAPAPGPAPTGGDSRVWMLAANPLRARSEAERVVATLAELVDDLADRGVSHWYFRYAYGPEPGPEVLAYGRGPTLTPTYAALASLWSWAVPPLDVTTVAVEGKRAVRALHLRGADGRVAVVVVNRGDAAVEVTLDARLGRPERIVRCGGAGVTEDPIAAGAELTVEPGVVLVLGRAP